MGGGAPLMAAMVPWERLAPAIATLVEVAGLDLVWRGWVLGLEDRWVFLVARISGVQELDGLS